MNETGQVERFTYEAQTPDGRAMAGTLEAVDRASAQEQLRAMGLRVTTLASQHARPPRLPRPKRIEGEDFAAFNQQLAQLTASSLPLERGLRLIGADMPSRRLGRTVEMVAAELERGLSVEQAFERHARRFPTHYGRMLEAGVKTGNLQAVLINVGRQIQMMHRLRSMLTRAMAYPIVLLVMILGVLAFVSWGVVPPMRAFFADFNTDLPRLTRTLFAVGDLLPPILIAIGVAVLLVAIVWRAMRLSGRDALLVETVFWPLPLLGPVLRRAAAARWCGALQIGIDAGLDLPTSIRLAGEAIGSPTAMIDGRRLVQALEAGGTVDETEGLRMVPASATSTLQFAAERSDLPHAVEQLTHLYEHQAEQRLQLLRAAVVPIGLVFVAMVVTLVIAGLFMPLPRLISAVVN